MEQSKTVDTPGNDGNASMSKQVKDAAADVDDGTDEFLTFHDRIIRQEQLLYS